MSAPTIEEEHVLIQFRDRVKDVLETEDEKKCSFLIRWLRARNYDLHKSEKMLRASLTWRKVNGINHIVEMPLDDYYQRECPYYIEGQDKYGHPIVVLPASKYNLRKYVLEKTAKEINHYAVHSLESICRAIKSANSERSPGLYPITQFTLIADWKGCSYMQLCNLKVIQRMLDGAAIFEANYPEFFYRFLMINCPHFFTIPMLMIKTIVPAKTYDKIKVYGSDREVWEKACREIIDDAQFEKILQLIS